MLCVAFHLHVSGRGVPVCMYLICKCISRCCAFFLYLEKERFGERILQEMLIFAGTGLLAVVWGGGRGGNEAEVFLL